MVFVYVLRSLKDNQLYVGSTRQRIYARVSRHNRGQVRSTKNRRPLVLLYSEPFNNYSDARERELYLKSGSGREHLRRILNNQARSDVRAGTQVAKVDRL